MSSKIKNILMVHNYYLIGGGEHTVFHNEKNLLKENGYNVIEYTRDNKELKNIFKKLILPISMIWSFKTFFEVRKIIKKENIQIVHCHNTFPLISPSVYYAARSMNVPVVQTIHNFRFLCPSGTLYCRGNVCETCLKNNNFKMALKNNCYRNSKLQTFALINMLKVHRFFNTYKKINYIFLTDFNKSKFSSLIDINKDNVFVKPNFVDSKKIIQTCKKPKNKVIFMGRLEQNKGIDFLIENWNKIDNLELHIYGDGTLKDEVINASKINKLIKYYGFKPQNEIFDDLSDSYGLIFPSIWYEGFPMTITEAMAIGKPVISSNIGNQASIIEKSNGGVLYENKNFLSLKEKINDLKNNYETYSKNAKKYYEKELSEKSNLERLISIYEAAKIIK